MADRKFRIIYRDKDGNILKVSDDFYITKADAVKFAQLQFAKDNTIDHWNVSEVDTNSNLNYNTSDVEVSQEESVRRLMANKLLREDVQVNQMPIVYSPLTEEEYPFILKLAGYIEMDPKIVGDILAFNSDTGYKQFMTKMYLYFGKHDIEDLTDNDLKLIGSSREELDNFINDRL